MSSQTALLDTGCPSAAEVWRGSRWRQIGTNLAERSEACHAVHLSASGPSPYCDRLSRLSAQPSAQVSK